MEKIIENIFYSSLGVKEGEKGLIFFDNFNGDSRLSEREYIVKCFEGFALSRGISIKQMKINNTGGNGLEPDKLLWQETLGNDFVENIEKMFGWEKIVKKEIELDVLLNIAKSVELKFVPHFVIALPYHSTSHTSFRKLLNKLGTRYISMPIFDLKMFEGPLDIDFNELERETVELKTNLEGKKKCRIKDQMGTDISFCFGDREFKADSGNFRDSGSFGNLPAGEVFIAPLEDKTEGVIAITWAGWGRLEKPLFAEIKAGKVIRLYGDMRLKEYLENIFNRDDRNKVVCELGFGTNRGAKRYDNILEAEKIYGTAHIAFGDNVTFGGNNRATTHIDYLISEPEIRWGDD